MRGEGERNRNDGRPTGRPLILRWDPIGCRVATLGFIVESPYLRCLEATVAPAAFPLPAPGRGSGGEVNLFTGAAEAGGEEGEVEGLLDVHVDAEPAHYRVGRQDRIACHDDAWIPAA